MRTLAMNTTSICGRCSARSRFARCTTPFWPAESGADRKPGRYKVEISLDTGPLAGVLREEATITILGE